MFSGEPRLRQICSLKRSTGYRIMLLKRQYFGHLMWRGDSLEKTLMLGKIEGRRRRRQQRMRYWMASPTLRTWVWVNSRSWWWTGKPGVLQSMGLERVEHYWAIELNWTESDIRSSYWFPFPCHELWTWLYSLHFSYWKILSKEDSEIRQMEKLNQNRSSKKSWIVLQWLKLTFYLGLS